MAKGSLVRHSQTQYVVDKVGLGSEGGGEYRDDRGDEPRTYRMVFPAWEGPIICPAEGCSGWVSTRTAIRVHFWYHHIRYTVLILY